MIFFSIFKIYILVNLKVEFDEEELDFIVEGNLFINDVCMDFFCICFFSFCIDFEIFIGFFGFCILIIFKYFFNVF